MLNTLDTTVYNQRKHLIRYRMSLQAQVAVNSYGDLLN
jgi:hypothetical protein